MPLSSVHFDRLFCDSMSIQRKARCNPCGTELCPLDRGINKTKTKLSRSVWAHLKTPTVRMWKEKPASMKRRRLRDSKACGPKRWASPRLSQASGPNTDRLTLPVTIFPGILYPLLNPVDLLMRQTKSLNQCPNQHPSITWQNNIYNQRKQRYNEVEIKYKCLYVTVDY